MLEDPGEELSGLGADATRTVGIVTDRFAGLVPQADMDMQPVADGSRRHARAETDGVTVPPGGAARHLAQYHRLVAGRERLLRREGHLELMFAELGKVGVGLDPASGEGGKKSLAEGAMPANAVERIVVANSSSGSRIE